MAWRAFFVVLDSVLAGAFDSRIRFWFRHFFVWILSAGIL